MRTRGMTLIELLVAMSIFLVLGGALVLFLRVGIDTWRVGEIRRESFERAQSIIDQISDDLACTYSDPSHGTGGVVDVLFVSDYDAGGRQRLRFVRSLAGEMRHPITQRAGSLTSGRMDYDYQNDAIEAELGFLRAPGGLQEIAYLMDPDPSAELLWRGLKSPIGGYTTLFDDDNIYEPQGDEEDSPVVVQRCRPWAPGVLYLEFNFWGQATEVWSGEGDSAQHYWDSTRGILSEEQTGQDPGGHPDSRHEYRDDVFPSRVQVVLVLRPARATRFARLGTALTASADEIRVDTTRYYPEGAFQYIRIDNEWIRYESKTGRQFAVAERGARGTEATEHPAGSQVIYGATFSRVIRIPGARSSHWGQR